MKHTHSGIRTEYEKSDYIHSGKGYNFEALRLRQQVTIEAAIEATIASEASPDKRCKAISPRGVRCGMPIHETGRHGNGSLVQTWEGDFNGNPKTPGM